MLHVTQEGRGAARTGKGFGKREVEEVKFVPQASGDLQQPDLQAEGHTKEMLEEETRSQLQGAWAPSPKTR